MRIGPPTIQDVQCLNLYFAVLLAADIVFALCKPYWFLEYKFIITSFEEFLNSRTSKVYIVQATKLQVRKIYRNKNPATENLLIFISQQTFNEER